MVYYYEDGDGGFRTVANSRNGFAERVSVRIFRGVGFFYGFPEIEKVPMEPGRQVRL